ncbi:MAG: LacI family DNA-binding transcriptional regulator [Clostridia bacterium]|nr:LacI family DNA-binding transcriptional regulator [Clostridia bacterium]
MKKKAATIREVSRLSGVSTATVSRVVNNVGNVSEKTSRKVLNAIDILSYRINPLASGLKRGKVRTIGVILARMDTHYHAQVLKGIEDALSPEGYAIMFATTDNDANKEVFTISNMLSFNVDALIVATSQTEGDCFERINDENCPVVLIDRRVPVSNVDIISEENRVSSMRLTKTLTDAGHRKIAVFAGDKRLNLIKERIEGFIDAMASVGAEYSGEMTVYCQNSAHAAQTASAEAFGRWRAEGVMPSAAICLNSNVTEGVMLAARDMGISIPDDLSVASFGLLRSRLIVPSVTSVVQEGYRIGLVAGRQVLKRVGRDAKDIKPCDIVFQNAIQAGDSIKKITVNNG